MASNEYMVYVTIPYRVIAPDSTRARHIAKLLFEEECSIEFDGERMLMKVDRGVRNVEE